MVSKVEILSQVDLFRGLNQQQLGQIAELVETASYHEQDIVCRQGDAATSLYIVAQGQLEIIWRDASGQEHSVLFLGSGQPVGEMTLVDDGQRSASVIALTNETLVYVIENHKLNTLCEQDTAIGYHIMRNIAHDLSFKLRHRDYDPTRPSTEVE